MAEGLLRSHGYAVPPAPAKSIYKAATNHGSILDLDLPVDPRVMDAVRGMAEGTVADYMALRPDALTTPVDWIDKLVRGGTPTNMDVVGAAREFAPRDPAGLTDAIIVAMRNLGYDAMTHTGGLRAGGGKTLHDVLISLDPNDTISRVGRSGQITRFDPLGPEALKQLTGWG